MLLRRFSTMTTEHHAAAPTPVRLIREKEILERTGLSRTQRWRLEREGRFPTRVQLSERAFGWIESEVEAWIAERIRERRSVPIAA
jgi:prophage regulatory protein